VKTTAIAARMSNEGEVVAVELDSGRASQLRELAERLGASAVRVVEADAARDDVGDGYDRVLVDPPCSDLGALASRPDARWRKSPELVERLASIQEAILVRAARAVRPGGTLVYSTCTISAAENQRQVEDFLDRHADFQPCDLSGRHPRLALTGDRAFLQTLPHRDRTDGFFIAAVERMQ
jgi:16S rRNA (cytosine967-C5)-methyltransferase